MLHTHFWVNMYICVLHIATSCLAVLLEFGILSEGTDLAGNQTRAAWLRDVGSEPHLYGIFLCIIGRIRMRDQNSVVCPRISYCPLSTFCISNTLHRILMKATWWSSHRTCLGTWVLNPHEERGVEIFLKFWPRILWGFGENLWKSSLKVDMIGTN